MKQLLRISVLTLAVSTSGFLLAQGTANPGASPDSSGTGGSDQSMAGAGQTSASKGASTADDQTLHRQVHDQLSTNPDLQNVQIAVENGKVVLTGTVPNKNDKKEAKRIASSVPGVKKVKENITVSNPGGTSSASATSMGKPSDNQSTEQGNSPNNAGSISGNAGTPEPGNPGASSPSSGAFWSATARRRASSHAEQLLPAKLVLFLKRLSFAGNQQQPQSTDAAAAGFQPECA